MMKEPLSALLEAGLAEYRVWLKARGYNKALAWLAEVAHCVKHLISSELEKQLWRARLDVEAPDAEVARRALQDADEELGYVRTLIELDDYPVKEEEALRILSVREDVDLMRDFLLSRGIEAPQLDCTALDAAIARVAKSKRNRSAFDSAFRAMRRNMRVTLDTKWRVGSLEKYLSWGRGLAEGADLHGKRPPARRVERGPRSHRSGGNGI